MAKREYTPALGFDWLTGMYDLTIKLTMPERKFRSRLIDYVEPGLGEHILEFGFGTGANLMIAAQRSKGSSFIGLDIDPKVLGIADNKLKGHGIDIPLKLYEGGTFPFGPGSFDKAYSCLVFHHLDSEQKREAFAELYRILKPGGKLIIGDWGKPTSQLMRTAFYAVQLVDGFKTTKDNVEGRLPHYIAEAGFSKIQEVGFLNTAIGSFCYYHATK